MDSFLAVLVVFTPILVVSMQILAQRDRTKRSAEHTAQTAEIHILVNSRLQNALDRIKALEHALGIGEGEAIPKPRAKPRVKKEPPA